MQLICTNCSALIKAEDVNISTNLAKCKKCDSLYKASELLELQKDAQLDKPPAGSQIQLKKEGNDRVEIYYPKIGFTTMAIPILIFTIVWLGAIAYWTLGAAKGSLFFALISIPFWWMGGAMFMGLLNAVYETQTLIIDKTTIKLRRNRPMKSCNFEVNFKDIYSIELREMKDFPFSAFIHLNRVKNANDNITLEVPSILTGSETIHFFEGAVDAEQEWVVGVLTRFVKKYS